MPRATVETFDETGEVTETEPQSPSGWEADATEHRSSSASADGACIDGFQRHKWDGGSVCARCGAQKETRTATTRRNTSASVKQGKLENLFATAWMAMGYGVERVPASWGIPGTSPRKDDDGNPISAAPSVAVGRALQMEAAVAGRRLDRAFYRVPAYRIVAKWLEPAGAMADVMPLLFAPVLAGLFAAKPEMGERLRPLMVGALVPLLAEQAKMAEAQAALLSQLEGITAETVEQANSIVDRLISPEL